jgi:anaerobic C4-dicarboxylate transporter
MKRRTTEKIIMKYNRIAVWGFLFAAVLSVLAGLRDWFAPGFFSISPQVPGRSQIIGNFLIAVMCLALAATIRNREAQEVAKK